MSQSADFDVIVVGAGSAGLSAALTLGRSRRRVLVLDGGPPRNAPAAHVHNLFTHDGTPPTELLRRGREQLAPYHVALWPLEARTARAVAAGFALGLTDGTEATARALLLATGVTDVLPAIPGFRELWGRGVYHCPYCHGWEIRGRRVAVYGRGAAGFHLAVLLHHWAPGPVLCSDGPADLDASQQATLQRLGVRVLETPLAALEADSAGVQAVAFADGSRLPIKAVFARVPQQQRSGLAAQLGCRFTDDGVYVHVDATGLTSVPGVYAAGDLTSPFQQVSAAAAAGSGAAAMLNNELIFRDSTVAP